MKTISQQIYEYGIVPVVKLDDPKHAVPLAKALLAGGICCIEVTFRTDAAEESIKSIAEECPEMLVGAGTVLTIDQINRATAAGAKFIVSPGFNITTAKYCVENNIPIYPGCNNPASIESALELGITDLKFFPAEQSGGLPMIKALCAPYVNVRFMPTGGINENNLNDYLSFNKIIACGGTWMVKSELMNEGRFDEIEALSREAIHKMLGFELRHIGINCENEAEATTSAKMLCDLFGLPFNDGSVSIFVGKEFELMKSPYLGKNGHICLAVNNLDRAFSHLTARGYEFNGETIKYDEKGKMKLAYFKNEIAGFALHLINK